MSVFTFAGSAKDHNVTRLLHGKKQAKRIIISQGFSTVTAQQAQMIIISQDFSTVTASGS
jgi:hypothetical protein